MSEPKQIIPADGFYWPIDGGALGEVNVGEAVAAALNLFCADIQIEFNSNLSDYFLHGAEHASQFKNLPGISICASEREVSWGAEYAPLVPPISLESLVDRHIEELLEDYGHDEQAAAMTRLAEFFDALANKVRVNLTEGANAT